MPVETERQLNEAIQMRESGDLEGSHRALCLLVSQVLERDGRTTYDAQISLSQLGRTLRAMKRFDEAAELHWEVLATRAEVLGRSADNTHNSVHILCDTLQMMSRPELIPQLHAWIAAVDDNVAATAGPAVEAAILKARTTRNLIAARGISKLITEYLGTIANERIEPAGVRKSKQGARAGRLCRQ